MVVGKGKVTFSKSGVSVEGGQKIPKVAFYKTCHYPDVVTYLQNDTNLTRKTIAEILIGSGRLEDFKKNPQMFMDGAVRIIRSVMAQMMVDGIKYHRIGGDIWAQKLFENEELFGYFDQNDPAQSNMVPTPTKGIYDYTVYDSADVERNFALELEKSNDVRLFAKLPDWFKIPTPLGTYNPDWAVVIEQEGDRQLYFVVETKGTDAMNKVPEDQRGKIKCGFAHFQALDAGKGKDFGYIAPVKTFSTFLDRVSSFVE